LSSAPSSKLDAPLQYESFCKADETADKVVTCHHLDDLHTGTMFAYAKSESD